MDNSERLRDRGRLVEKEQEAKRMALCIDGDLRAIRMLLDPFAPLAEIQAEHAAVQAVELAGKHAEYLGLLAEIANIKKALGI